MATKPKTPKAPAKPKEYVPNGFVVHGSDTVGEIYNLSKTGKPDFDVLKFPSRAAALDFINRNGDFFVLGNR